MNYHTQIKPSMQRRGTHHRINNERFFSIQQLGWFYYRRGTGEQYQGIELHVGVCGPFRDRNEAEQHLQGEMRRSARGR